MTTAEWRFWTCFDAWMITDILWRQCPQHLTHLQTTTTEHTFYMEICRPKCYEHIWCICLIPMLLNNTNIKILKSHQSMGISIRECLKLELPGNILSYIHTLSRPQWVGWVQCTKHPNTLWDFLILLSQCSAALLLWEAIRKDWLNGYSSYVQVWGPVFIFKKHSRFKLYGFYLRLYSRIFSSSDAI